MKETTPARSRLSWCRVALTNPGARGEETEHGEPCEHPGAGHEGRGPIAAAERHVLGPVPGTNGRRLDGLGGEAKPDDGEQEEAGEDRVRDYERGSHELGQRSREQCANSKAPKIGGRGDDLEPAGASAGARERVEIAQVGGRRGRDHPNPQSADESGHDKARNGGPQQEQPGGKHLDGEGRDEDAAPTHPVRDVSGKKQTDDHAHRIDGEDDRDDERREAVALLVEDIERRGDGRERHRDEERRRRQPESRAIAGSRR